MLDTWLQDARHALRLLRKSPLFTATAALSLAIGIDANTTISPSQVRCCCGRRRLAEPDRVVDIGRTRNGHAFDTVSYPNYADFRRRTRMSEDVYAIRLKPQPMSIAGRDGAERVTAQSPLPTTSRARISDGSCDPMTTA